jgi:hypothetical protein
LISSMSTTSQATAGERESEVQKFRSSGVQELQEFRSCRMA